MTKIAKSRSPRTAAPSRANVAARDAQGTRARIVEAAKKLFSQNSYEGVGLREIAATAAVDPALIVRYFGSKEGLFRVVAAHAFGADPFLRDGAQALPRAAAHLLSDAVDEEAWRAGYDPLRLLLCSIGSATAGPIVSAHLCGDFIAPIAKALDGAQKDERAVLLAGSIVGLGLIRIAQASSGDGASGEGEPFRALLVKMLDAVVNDVTSDAPR